MDFETHTMDDILFDAIELGCVETLRRAILFEGGYVNANDSEGNTLLHAAVLKQNEDIIKLLIDIGADVNLVNDEGCTAMSLALNFEYVAPIKTKILKTLVGAGADVNTTARDGYNHSALLVAVENRDVDFMRFLVSRGADVNAKDAQILFYAAANVNSEDPTIFEVLLSAGADPNAKTYNGITPLHVLSIFNPRMKSRSLYDIMKVFSTYGANFKAKDNADKTPLQLAIETRHIEAIKAFVHLGVIHINFSKNLSGKTILHVACFLHDYGLVKFLLKNGANINTLDKNGISPLNQFTLNSCTLAGHARNGFELQNFAQSEESIANSIKVLRYLLKWNPDVNTINVRGQNILTPLQDRRNTFAVLSLGVIVEHLAKLQATGSTIHKSLLETISNDPRCNNYFIECCRELQLAKNCILHPDSWVTLFNLLMDDKRMLVLHAGNAHLTKCLSEKTKLRQSFPIYGCIIHARFSKAVKKREIWDNAAVVLSHLLPIPVDPTHQVTLNILKFFNLDNLRKLC